jgi:hypothetical protein
MNELAVVSFSGTLERRDEGDEKDQEPADDHQLPFGGLDP